MFIGLTGWFWYEASAHSVNQELAQNVATELAAQGRQTGNCKCVQTSFTIDVVQSGHTAVMCVCSATHIISVTLTVILICCNMVPFSC